MTVVGIGRPEGQGFRRDPGAPFDDLRKEEFAKARARGGSIRASSNVAGVQYATGIKWEKHPEMMARVREMRTGADDFVGATTGWVIGELKKNVEQARENLQFKASNEALSLIYKLVTEDKDAALKAVRALPASVQGRELQSRVMDAFNAPTPRARKKVGAPRDVNLLESAVSSDLTKQTSADSSDLTKQNGKVSAKASRRPVEAFEGSPHGSIGQGPGGPSWGAEAIDADGESVP